MAEERCETCGLPIDPDARRLELGELVLRTEARELTCRGRAVKLQPMQVRLVAVMMRHAGEGTFATLLKAMGSTNKKHAEVQIHHIRKRLLETKMPVTIATVRGAGYRLEVLD